MSTIGMRLWSRELPRSSQSWADAQKNVGLLDKDGFRDGVCEELILERPPKRSVELNLCILILSRFRAIRLSDRIPSLNVKLDVS
ncbi:hypothetical protein BASA60_000719 [Batrachochytrium salamandrivorans]|nr:hypothetical protein BASA60_000719 [Batrachochytrium salamandrivorans]